MAKKVKRPVIPIYAIGVVWLLYALLGSLYRLSDYLLCAGLSLGAFWVLSKLFPTKSYEVPDEQPQAKPQQAQDTKPKGTGSKEIDELIDQRDKAVSEMRRLNDAIQDPVISAHISHLETVTRKICDVVAEQPKKLPQIRKFLNYYLPTTLKLLNAYDRMSAAGIDGENITATKQKVEGMMATISAAFDRQLDALYGEDALDISTDITVMEQILQQEGLSGGMMGGNGPGDISLEL